MEEHPTEAAPEAAPKPKPTTDNVLSIVMSENQLSPEAKAWIRTNFNPSGDGQVRRLKLFAAAYMTEVQRIRDANLGDVPGSYAARQAAISLTHIQTASMFAVLAATERLP